MAAGRLDGKVAIVTGAGQGIGRALAHRLAAEGARVAVADVDAAKAASVAAEVADAGGVAEAVPVDVGDAASVEAMVERVAGRFGRIDGLVNNAAIFSTIRMRPFEELPLEEWELVLRVNLTGTFLCCRAVAPRMRARGAGSIVNVSSGTVMIGRPFYAHYVASKAGVVGLTRALARELGADGVRINALLPGSTVTEVPRETVTPEEREALVAAQSIRRALVPADLVGTVVFLLSDDSAMLTGQSIAVDGGMAFL